MEEGIALLVSKAQSLLAVPTAEQRQKSEEKFEQRLQIQKEAFRAQKRKESQQNISKILQGKRQKLLKQGLEEKGTKRSSNFWLY